MHGLIKITAVFIQIPIFSPNFPACYAIIKL